MADPVRASAPLPAAVVDSAIDWYARLASGLEDEAERIAFSRWHEADATHAEAWRRVQALGDRMARNAGLVAPPLARRVLDATIEAPGRRRLLKTLAWAGTGATGLWLLRDPLALPERWDGVVADASTARGERRDLRLPDGSRLRLNTASAVDIRFDAHRRLLVLRHGEIEVTTTADAMRCPFGVETADGRLVPVSTRFGVRRDDGRGTLLTVSEGAVQAWPTGGERPLRVDAGRQLRFERGFAGAITPLDESAVAWTLGLISANRMRLGHFVGELARYRSGWLRCDPAVADLRVTAVHRIDGPASVEAILASLQEALPVRVSQLTRYWVTVGPRAR
ncbi:FecR domain-containing protein [[Pseudomonas] boreopolis]|uniref:FecR domain-containing protein n=1 Tax=Xanthomonas boreopolis TaxID=86183 RepID=UPI003D9BAF45